jgi:hypothetical protein
MSVSSYRRECICITASSCGHGRWPYMTVPIGGKAQV